jgi:diadenosine tetraphosphate (Ap4A) HIT family hydrolase
MIVVVQASGSDSALCRPQLLTPVIRESTHWRIAINRNQNLLGKLLIALRRHEESVSELTAEEWSGLRDELRWAVGRIDKAFRPDHFNYALLRNQEFADPDWPDHYSPGVEYLASRDVIAAIADAIG